MFRKYMRYFLPFDIAHDNDANEGLCGKSRLRRFSGVRFPSLFKAWITARLEGDAWEMTADQDESATTSHEYPYREGLMR